MTRTMPAASVGKSTKTVIGGATLPLVYDTITKSVNATRAINSMPSARYPCPGITIKSDTNRAMTNMIRALNAWNATGLKLAISLLCNETVTNKSPANAAAEVPVIAANVPHAPKGIRAPA